MNIVAISGSLRKDSFNTALLHAFQESTPADMKIEIVSIAELPMYSGDIEAPYPAAAQTLRNAIEKADGLIIATPEYNRSMSGALKNAIDWLTRPSGTNSFSRKPVLVAGVSNGKRGAVVAQSQLRQVLTHLNANVIGQPELNLGPASEIFGVDGSMTDAPTRESLVKALDALRERVAGSV